MEHERVLRAQVSDLKSRLQQAEDRVYVLEQALGVAGGKELCMLGFTGTEATILGVLHKRQVATRNQMHTALYIDRPNLGEDTSPWIIDTYLVHLRKKLAEHGVTISNIHGHGWTIGAEGRAKITDLLAAARLT